MKISQAAFFTSAAVFGSAAEAAVTLKSLFRHGNGNTAAVDAAADEDKGERQLNNNNCWQSNSGTSPTAAWHPTYSAGWTDGYCQFNVDCNSPSYSSELACCKGAYAGQISGKCLARLPNPPTSSPTGSGGLAVYYPDYATAWPEAGCINTRPMPSGRPTYTSMLACCKGAYGGQMSGKCLSQLPNPPTSSPTTSGGVSGFWYPDYDTAWSVSGCKNTLPLPYPNKNDRPNYNTQLACCKGAYGGQVSGTCLANLANPPTMSPTGGNGRVGFWYPDYETAWSVAGCKNTRPLPYNNIGDRPNYTTQVACCKGAYGGQVSGECLSQLANPPTSAPSSTMGTEFYPDYGTTWSVAGCINTRPVPSGRPTYTSKEMCCNGAYGGQGSMACMCDAKQDVCYSCACGTQAERDTAGCGKNAVSPKKYLNCGR